MKPTPTKYRQYLDLETHEIVTGDDIYKKYSEEEAKVTSRFSWARFYPKRLVSIQKAIRSASFDVIMYFFKELSFADNQFTCSRTEVAEKTGISRATISRVFKGLQDHNVIRKVKGSTWMVNPVILHAGNKHMGAVLYNIYQKLPASKAHINHLREPLEIEDDDLLALDTLFDDAAKREREDENDNN